MLLTEPGLLGVPACIVAFEFDPTGRSRIVTLTFIRPVPPLDDAEDYSGDP